LASSPCPCPVSHRSQACPWRASWLHRKAGALPVRAALCRRLKSHPTCAAPPEKQSAAHGNYRETRLRSREAPRRADTRALSPHVPSRVARITRAAWKRNRASRLHKIIKVLEKFGRGPVSVVAFLCHSSTNVRNASTNSDRGSSKCRTMRFAAIVRASPVLLHFAVHLLYAFEHRCHRSAAFPTRCGDRDRPVAPPSLPPAIPSD